MFSKIATLVSCLLLFAGHAIWAQDAAYTLAGTVYGKKTGRSSIGRPEKDVYLTVYQVDELEGRPTLYELPSNAHALFTNYEGEFEIELNPTQAYMIEVAKEGFAVERLNISPKEGVDGRRIGIEVHLKEGVSGVLTEQYVDSFTKQPLPNTRVTLKTEGTDDIRVALTNAQGECFFIFSKPRTSISISAYKKGYFLTEPERLHVDLMDISRSARSKELTPINIGQWVRLQEFGFGINSDELQEAGMMELNRLLELMQDNPSLRVEIACHTDARGDDTYNMLLSQKRAEAAVDYLISLGVARRRLRPQGYGETKLLNHCANGVRCDNSKHAENRRMEYMVYAIEE